MPRKGYRNKLGFRRKSHKKLRLGCATCKRRRIKCSEELPECEECVKLGEHCDYLDYTKEQLDRLRRLKLHQNDTELEEDPGDFARLHSAKWLPPHQPPSTIKSVYDDIPQPLYDFHDMLGFSDMSPMMPPPPPLASLPPGQLPLPSTGYNATMLLVPLASVSMPASIPSQGASIPTAASIPTSASMPPLAAPGYTSFYDFPDPSLTTPTNPSGVPSHPPSTVPSHHPSTIPSHPPASLHQPQLSHQQSPLQQPLLPQHQQSVQPLQPPHQLQQSPHLQQPPLQHQQPTVQHHQPQLPHQHQQLPQQQLRQPQPHLQQVPLQQSLLPPHDPLKCTVLDCYLCHHSYPPP